MQASPAASREPRAGGIALFLVAVFPLSWALWTPVILYKNNPVFLNLSGGPALAAMWVASSRRGKLVNPARVVAFAVCVPLFWLIAILNVALNSSSFGPLRLNPGLLLPAAISACIVSGAFSGNRGVRALLRGLISPPDWSGPVAALLALPAFLAVSVAAGRVLGLPVIRPGAGLTMTQIAGFTVIRFLHDMLFVGTFEEPGWRGFLLPRLQSRFSPLMASILVWIPWAIWHLPLDFARPGGWTWGAIFQQRVVALLLFSILMTWLYNQSRGGLLSAVVFHGATNSFPFILPSCAALLVPLAIVLVLMAVFSSRMWRRQSV